MKFSEAHIELLAKDHYGLFVSAKMLNGYDELNYLLTDINNKQFILKVSDENQPFLFLDAQVKIIKHLSNSSISNNFQQFCINNQGDELTAVENEGKKYYLRILSFLEGDFWVDKLEKSNILYSQLGHFLGTMDKSLQDFSHTAMHRQYTWDISRASDANDRLKYIKNHEKRRIASYFLLQFDTEVLPKIHTLRHAYIHNDANDYNVLVDDNTVTGLIDFGDMVYTALINNLAIACTYAMLSHEDPLSAATLIVKGYHESYALTTQELDVLYYLIAGRLCISVTQSAFNGSLDTNNDHHFITEKPAWDLLYKLIKINPIKAQDNFRKTCGFEGVISNDNYSDLLEKRHKYLGKNLSIGYKENLKIVKGALQYLYDDKGKTYIDCVNNPSHVGHCHPVVVRSMQKQIATLNTNTRYLNNTILEYAEKLTATLPPQLCVCYFVNSGSEANDLAIRMSRHFTKQKDIIVLDHAYHGTSTVAMEMSPYKFDSKGGSGKMPWIHKATNPDLYRGEFKYGDENAGQKYAADVQRIIENLDKENKAPAVFICETLLGVGGQMPLPKNYLKTVYNQVRKAGGVCIADEVQVGFGRVGDAFWGFELQDVIPDIVVLGKPIGNGHPLAAVIVTNEIADAFNNGLEYFNTFGGNPVSMAAGLAVLNVIQEEEMQAHAKEVGNYLIDGLNTLMQKHTIISDVRGHGLFIGAEMVKDRTTMEPAITEIDIVVEKMKEKGYLLSTDGPLHNVLKIKPPMPFSKQNATEMVQLLDVILSELKI
ncbi:aminotransferase class III-fold pyridoxal phosphate-dependent enzyme [Flavobacterium psychrophilum]|uniref:aminotransferase class III-fold pyridoxal phosphate-dependent enzyme n=1 Tax=Flavobacterium psychrophilum TaxID=96345 RepID=UPI0004F83399|nr:aminotransferase class III-fold pyridoxal phosphate-dependent enzyme [Flavobacterium psychrophilum]AIN74021.1 aminotransferase [Flavobacterium psychrophilum FPG3]EKT2069545.1 aminotransferase class III-fold pyridoxal phosphate-dependent enzyme [Flavobacterium psychrophilum]EKT3964122.1 aminotransferase class III-fold pyridoxal phosphate-dependent enzyme [Flavobacterium psychrophilum]EKT4497766.1 aminotransferase class III-fold pyridoxal phosphate-dependent enzyme [Flavobacterium psychrophilu